MRQRLLAGRQTEQMRQMNEAGGMEGMLAGTGQVPEKWSEELEQLLQRMGMTSAFLSVIDLHQLQNISTSITYIPYVQYLQ